MKRENYLLVMVAGLVLACLVAFFVTADWRQRPAAKTPVHQNNRAPLVDDQLLQTARRLFSIADTPGERELAGEALRIADHQLDQAFATALRQTQATLPPASGPLQQLNARGAQLKTRMQAYDSRIARLSKQVGDNSQWTW